MHPKLHLIVTTLAATALGRPLGPLALAFWAGGVFADLDHLLWHSRQTGRLNLPAAWEYFDGDGRGVAPERPLPLHRWPVILVGLALTPVIPLAGAAAGGLAFHRVLDDLTDRVGPSWRARTIRRKMALSRAVAERAGNRCEHCGATGTRLQAHRLRPHERNGQHQPDNLIALCVPCHERAHGKIAPLS